MPVQVELFDKQFSKIVRNIKKGPIEKAELIRSATHTTLKRLGVRRNLKKAVVGIPAGSDQANVGNILAWLEKVGPNDKKAIQQVVAIDATAVVRMR